MASVRLGMARGRHPMSEHREELLRQLAEFESPAEIERLRNMSAAEASLELALARVEIWRLRLAIAWWRCVTALAGVRR
jgi:hypothetical protein